MAARRCRVGGLPIAAAVMAVAAMALAAPLCTWTVHALDLQSEVSVFRLPLDLSGLHPADDAMFEVATPPPPVNAAGQPLLMTTVVVLVKVGGGALFKHLLPYYLGESYGDAMFRLCDELVQLYPGVQRQGEGVLRLPWPYGQGNDATTRCALTLAPRAGAALDRTAPHRRLGPPSVPQPPSGFLTCVGLLPTRCVTCVRSLPWRLGSPDGVGEIPQARCAVAGLPAAEGCAG